MPSKPQKVEDDIGEPIKVDVDVVNLYCAVRNKQNALISTLEKGDFTLAEDGTHADHQILHARNRSAADDRPAGRRLRQSAESD